MKLEEWKKDTVNGLNLYREAIKLNSFELLMQDLKYCRDKLSLTDEECFELVKDCYLYLLDTWDTSLENRVDWFKKLEIFIREKEK